MRFLENGPAIPSHLLAEQALGNVIFFCGAGVSRRAGLPTFEGLTSRILVSLVSDDDREAYEGDHFDRVFNVLIRMFGRPEIDREIYEALRTPESPDLNSHRPIIELSKNLSGNPQIVTTNFDLLFEEACTNIRPYIPPSLPELALGDSIQGVVYLHGRLTRSDPQTRAGYILSSGDFGRAYIADGWAARFVRALRERHTIALVGYSADDPPMRYLLEGLHSQEGGGYKAPIYAFAAGKLSEIEDGWRERGVTLIAYDLLDADHSGLWNTLSAWAEASANPDAWTDHVLSLAARRPSELKAFERGQVAQLVSSKGGAKLFADADPVPAAEWLCVFDRTVRYAKPRKPSFEEDAEEIDPHDLFGLDDDPERPLVKPGQQAPDVGTNYLQWMGGETAYPERAGLAGWPAEAVGQLPERLRHLAHWFGKVAHKPAAAWWAAGWSALHPEVIWFIARQLREEGNWSGPARRFWQLYTEAARFPAGRSHEYPWFELRDLIKQDGWSDFALREYERALQPRVTFLRYPYGKPQPPIGDWSDTPLQHVVEMKVKVLDRHGEPDDVPSDKLPLIVELVRRSLVLTAQLMVEVGTIWWNAPTLHPTGSPSESFHGGKTLYFLWFAALFCRLKEANSEAALAEIRQWPHSERYFFGKLIIYALEDGAFFPPDEATALLLEIDDDVFFDSYNRRELLFTLRARWPGLSDDQRRTIERRIIKGRPLREDENAPELRQRRASNAATILRWLELNGCELTPATATELPKLKAADPDWNDRWVESADDSYGIRGGAIAINTDVRGIDELPLDQIVLAAQKKSGRRFEDLEEDEPFKGLVKSNPFRALSALRREAKRSNHPIRYWMDLLNEWPEDSPLRLRWLMAGTIAALPPAVAQELRYYAPSWLEKHLKALYEADRQSAFKLFDKIVAVYVGASAHLTNSSIGTSSIGGVAVEKS